MITIRKNIRIFPRNGHQLIDFKGDVCGFLDDNLKLVVDIKPLSTPSSDALRHAANALGYSRLNYIQLSYEGKLKAKRMIKEII